MRDQSTAMERATGGQVTRADLRPLDWQQIWPKYTPPVQQAMDAPAGAQAAQGQHA